MFSQLLLKNLKNIPLYFLMLLFLLYNFLWTFLPIIIWKFTDLQTFIIAIFSIVLWYSTIISCILIDLFILFTLMILSSLCFVTCFNFGHLELQNIEYISLHFGFVFHFSNFDDLRFLYLLIWVITNIKILIFTNLNMCLILDILSVDVLLFFNLLWIHFWLLIFGLFIIEYPKNALFYSVTIYFIACSLGIFYYRTCLTITRLICWVNSYLQYISGLFICCLLDYYEHATLLTWSFFFSFE